MSTSVLHIDSSIFGEAGVSNQLGKTLIQELEKLDDSLSITHRDLSQTPVPHFDADTIGRLGAGEEPLADTLIAELQAAELVIIGAPMYNFAIPSSLKAWFDHVARAGVTFKYTENGPVGLLTGKKVIVITSRGGVHRDSPTDTQTPYLKTMLGFLGMDDVTFVYAEGLNLSGGVREEAIAKAEAALASYAPQLLAEEVV